MPPPPHAHPAFPTPPHLLDVVLHHPFATEEVEVALHLPELDFSAHNGGCKTATKRWKQEESLALSQCSGTCMPCNIPAARLPSTQRAPLLLLQDFHHRLRLERQVPHPLAADLAVRRRRGGRSWGDCGSMQG